MDSNFKLYDHVASASRIRTYLNQSDLDYTETDALPDRDKLTFSNGFYASCSAVFIDIRGSSKLPSEYKRPTLARIYRSYISEVVAVLNSAISCREVNIVGDGAWAVYNTPLKPDIDNVFAIAFNLSSMIDILNEELKRSEKSPITVGIGASYGRALMVKAGYSGSGINDVVYMGDVVNAAAKLAAHGSKSWGDGEIMISDIFYSNLNDHNKGLLSYHYNYGCYHGNVINASINEWVQQNYQ